MADSIIDSVMSFLGPQLTGPLAAQMGESTESVQRGLQGGAAAMLAGLAAKADEPGFVTQIFGMITNPANTPAALTGLTSNLNTADAGGSPLRDLGGRFLSTVFGSRAGAVADAVGQSSGMGASKASTLLSMAAPLVLAGLGKFVRDNNVSPATLGSELKNEVPILQRFLPAGFRNLFAGGASSAVASFPAQDAATTNKWLWPVVLLAALLLTGLWFVNRAKGPMQEAGNMMGNAAASALGEFFKTKLPNGVELNIPRFGIENKLLAFIQDASKLVDDMTWFNFDRLLFDTGKATLQPSSEEQLNNIAKILKAYPEIHVKIGGYTDNTGDPASNKVLSEARAKNVMDALIAKSVDALRMESEGYGDQYPVADNSTEEGRAKNRRIALRVTQKE